MLGADVLTEMLIAYGVEVIFGVPGDTNVPLYESLRQRQDRIRHVMARDERSAGCMADAYARITNRPGAFEAPSGAGPMYSLPPLAEAHFSAVPVILITCDTPLRLERRGVISEFESAKLFDAITKDSHQVKAAAMIPDAVRRAFRIATSGRPGAVHLVVPEDILLQEVEEGSVSLHIEPECMRFPAHAASPSSTQTEQVLNVIRAAERPLLVAGGGVNRSDAGRLLQAVAERLDIPIATTITGQGAVPDDHRLALGVIGDNGFHPHAVRAAEDADLLIYLGSKLGSVVTVGWTFPSGLQDRRIIHVDIDPAVLGNNTARALNICADVGAFLASLLQCLPPAEVPKREWTARLNGWRETFWTHARAQLEDRTVPLKPARVMQALAERLDGPATLVSDPGTPTPYATRFLRLTKPGSCVVVPRAFGGLGFAIPAVVGAWYARPSARILGMFGDGSFGMSVGELETIARLAVPALLLHFNNASFGLIKAVQRLHGRNATQSVDFSATNAAKVAEAFGLRAWRVTDAASLDAALDAAFAHSGPCFIDLVVESIADVAPPMYSWTRKLGHDPASLAPASDLRIGDYRAHP
jgi:acetolactate synthase-1/2/3 large subunit